MINTIVHYVNFYYPTLKNLNYSEHLLKTALIYRFLYETTFKKHITLETIIYKLKDKYESVMLNTEEIYHILLKIYLDSEIDGDLFFKKEAYLDIFRVLNTGNMYLED